MHAHYAVVDLAPVAVVLTAHAHGFVAALRRSRLVHAADRFAMRMVASDHLLAAVAEFFFIPLDRFEKTLQRPRRCAERQSDRFGGLAVHIRQLPFHINSQQVPPLASPETIREQRQKQRQLPSQRRNLF